MQSFYCVMNIMGYSCGSKRLLAMSRKKGPPFGRSNAGLPTASK